MKETFRFIKGHDDRYLVSDAGSVKSIKAQIMRRDGKKYSIKGKILKGEINNCGYKRVYLYSSNKKIRMYVHRIVAETFIPNLENKPHINHLNGIKTDNRVENLEWCTPKENGSHATMIGLYPRGEKHHASKLCHEDVLFIRKYKKGYYLDEKTNKMKSFTYNYFAKLFDVDRSAIYAAYKGITWTHV